MERNFYNDEFEQLVRQKADQYKMYPSDQVWKGVYKSIHGRRRWPWAGLAVLLLGLGIYTGNYYLSGKPANKIAENMEPSINATNQEFNQNTTADNNTATTSASGDRSANNSTDNNNINRSGSLSQSSTSFVALPNDQRNGNNIQNNNTIASSTLIANNISNNNTVTAPFVISRNETSGIITNNPEGWNRAVTNNNAERISRTTNIAITETQKSSVQLPDSKMSLADAASESVLDDKKQGVNWLQDYAVFQLTANKPKRLGMQIYFSPTVNYRKLHGSSNFPTSEVKSIPLAMNIMGDVDQYVKHKPALGFEVGAAMMYRTSKRVTYKAGLQFNYSRYNIQAYQALPELATIALNTSVAFQADTVSTLSTIRNLSGYGQEDISNQYFQVSMPVGLEFRVIGTDKLQLSVAGTVQPTYLINRNSYLITTDYRNYMREPSLVRKWNVNGGLEAFVSYNTGTVRWQVGPQVRYQLFSTYAKKYPIKEQLMEYGFKIAVSRMIQ